MATRRVGGWQRRFTEFRAPLPSFAAPASARSSSRTKKKNKQRKTIDSVVIDRVGCLFFYVVAVVIRDADWMRPSLVCGGVGGSFPWPADQ